MQIILQQMPIVIVVVLLSLIILLLWIAWLTVRLGKLTRGSDGNSLEKHVDKILQYHEITQKTQQQTNQKLEELDVRLSDSIRGIGLERFNPFAGSGDSKPSFALALLNERGDGIIISTLHARDRVTLFSKTITQFAPESEITDEEGKALEKARNSLQNTGQ